MGILHAGGGNGVGKTRLAKQGESNFLAVNRNCAVRPTTQFVDEP